jgi:hypothetical protein
MSPSERDRAFSGEAEIGSPPENTIKQRPRAFSDLMESSDRKENAQSQ